MRITRLEMTGFKSFATRTIADFQGGVMSVVGPNGCGKTNIVDAIRWVLGEQRSGTLRADRMDDLIFNGTKKRRALGLAEVTLAIDNDKGILPSPFSELEITRRLYRSGESEYLINRTTSRLRDIQDSFSDTGFGHNAYSIIELSMVEGIISGSSEARRALIDEAAGVSKFKSRRSSTERRLKTTKENLARLDDVFGELEKRYRSLKRQAGKASRYKGLARSLELRLIIDLAEERSDIFTKRDPLENELAELVQLINNSEEKITAASNDLEKLQDKELSLIDQINRSQNSLKNYERQESEMSSDLALARQQLEHVSVNIASREKRIVATKTAIVDIDAQINSLQKDIELISSNLEIKEKLRRETEKAYNIDRDTYTKHNLEIKKLRSSEDEARLRLTKFLENVKDQEFQTQRLTTHIKSISGDVTDVSSQIEADTLKLNELKVRDGVLLDKKEKCSQNVKSKIEDLSLKREQHSKCLIRVAQLKSQVVSYEEQVKAHEKSGGPALSSPKSLAKIIDTEKLLTVGNRIKCEDKYKAALAAGLRTVLEAVDIQGAGTTFELISNFKENENAVIRLLNENTNNANTRKLPDTVIDCWRASDLVLNGDQLGQFIKNRVGDLVIVTDIESLRELIPNAVKLNFRIATLNGDIYEPDGVIYAGNIDPDALQIGWEDKYNTLKAELFDYSTKLKEAHSNLKTTENQETSAESELKINRQALADIESKSATVRSNISSTSSLIRQSESRLTQINNEIISLTEKLTKIGKTENIDQKKERLQNEVDLTENNRHTGIKLFHAAERERINTAEKRASMLGEISTLNEKLRGLKSRIANLRDIQAKLDAELVEFDRLTTMSRKETQRINMAIESLDLQITTNKGQKDKFKDSLTQCENDRDNMAETRRDINSTANAAREEQKDLLNKRSNLDGELIGLRERLREVDRRLIEETQISPSTVGEHTVTNAITEMEELGHDELSAEKLRTRISSLGPVNMLALEELTSVEERYHFMSDQRQDLTKGIEVLEETIDLINIEARRRFRETFDIVNINFQELFRSMFTGGEARITLEGSDPLSADIRIWAALRGKKLQNLSMLSGGEKALTALSLLFGIYKVRPSPFCILDEVDAPLDDTNIDRFNHLVSQFAQNTQFMIVTHNKRTMEAADSLIGVTLKDDGTSQLVTVKLEEKANEA